MGVVFAVIFKDRCVDPYGYISICNYQILTDLDWAICGGGRLLSASTLSKVQEVHEQEMNKSVWALDVDNYSFIM